MWPLMSTCSKICSSYETIVGSNCFKKYTSRLIPLADRYEKKILLFIRKSWVSKYSPNFWVCAWRKASKLPISFFFFNFVLNECPGLPYRHSMKWKMEKATLGFSIKSMANYKVFHLNLSLSKNSEIRSSELGKQSLL